MSKVTPGDETSLRADPALVDGWINARSIARGLPPPVVDHGGWRVETASPTEIRRYLFVRPSPTIGDLAGGISDPRIFLKLFGSPAEMRLLLPVRWRLQPTIFMMTCSAPLASAARLPQGYTLDLSADGRVTRVNILGEDGELAASGYAAESAGVFIYDRIVVQPDHQRRGLGRALMMALGSARRSAASAQVLVATADGQALYATLGWTIHAPYTTARLADA
jgi:GNAT superfamily N-acetyltransferase